MVLSRANKGRESARFAVRDRVLDRERASEREKRTRVAEVSHGAFFINLSPTNGTPYVGEPQSATHKAVNNKNSYRQVNLFESE